VATQPTAPPGYAPSTPSDTSNTRSSRAARVPQPSAHRHMTGVVPSAGSHVVGNEVDYLVGGLCRGENRIGTHYGITTLVAEHGTTERLYFCLISTQKLVRVTRLSGLGGPLQAYWMVYRCAPPYRGRNFRRNFRRNLKSARHLGSRAIRQCIDLISKPVETIKVRIDGAQPSVVKRHENQIADLGTNSPVSPDPFHSCSSVPPAQPPIILTRSFRRLRGGRR
jgi:hypothetical protein